MAHMKIRYKLVGITFVCELVTLGSIVILFHSASLPMFLLNIPLIFLLAVAYIIGLIADHFFAKKDQAYPGFSAEATRSIIRKGMGGMILGILLVAAGYLWVNSGNNGEAPAGLLIPLFPMVLLVAGILIGFCTMPKQRSLIQ